MPLSPKKLAAAAARAKLSQAEVARRAGMSPANYGRVISGRRPNPALATAERIADALGVSIEKLLA